MSALAKKMMEKYGWKEGEGLGKERTGMKSYVKVTRRDPHTATGLGHAADPSNGGSLASTHAVELDAIYGQLHKETKNRKEQLSKAHPQRKETSTEVDDEDQLSDVSSNSRGASSSTSSTIADNYSEGEKVPFAARAQLKRQRHVPASSSSDSDGDGRKCSKNGRVGDVTRMTDEELLQRCGGVRLGRAGRHRYFDGKLKRIHNSS
ncbi:hypothetical protein JKF63_05471 [Porcisia hertigi]|uniref:G-patch domain-containing protein n=1 Tax=Porcisia hertigi TaxID=2761500 RepID=A0A836IMT6_9TRYP|nr:hypothetical protein JKF63_05471 [Porcisia hertigi]